MQSISVRSAQTSVPRGEIRSNTPFGDLLQVRKDVLDQQVIDVNHRKVVRVNDVDLDIQPTNGHTELRVLAVNVGLAAAVRRLLAGADGQAYHPEDFQLYSFQDHSLGIRQPD